MIDWNKFEDNLISYFRRKKSKSEKDTADFIAGLYDRNMRLGQTQYGNKILKSNKQTLERFFYAALINSRNGGNVKRTASLISSGIVLYWTTVIMDIQVPPPGAIQTITNVITSAGIPISINIKNTMDVSVLAKTMIIGFKLHCRTIQGLNTALIPSGAGTVPTPFPWVAIS